MNDDTINQIAHSLQGIDASLSELWRLGRTTIDIESDPSRLAVAAQITAGMAAADREESLTVDGLKTALSDADSLIRIVKSNEFCPIPATGEDGPAPESDHEPTAIDEALAEIYQQAVRKFVDLPDARLADILRDARVVNQILAVAINPTPVPKAKQALPDLRTGSRHALLRAFELTLDKAEQDHDARCAEPNVHQLMYEPNGQELLKIVSSGHAEQHAYHIKGAYHLAQFHFTLRSTDSEACAPAPEAKTTAEAGARHHMHPDTPIHYVCTQIVPVIEVADEAPYFLAQALMEPAVIRAILRSICNG